MSKKTELESCSDGGDALDIVRLYFDDIRPIPLLTREEEIELAQQIRHGQACKEKLLQGEDSPQERSELEEAVQQGVEALHHLVKANSRLVISIAKQYMGRGLPLLDLIQEGNLGLIRAAEKFDDRRGCKFSTYASWWIRQSLTRAIINQTRTIRLPHHIVQRIQKVHKLAGQLEPEVGHDLSAEDLAAQSSLTVAQIEEALLADQTLLSLDQTIGENENTTLENFIESEHVTDPAEEVDRILLQEQIQTLLEALPPREARVLAMRYGLYDGCERTLEEVGQHFGLTRERIRQIEQAALNKLRCPTRSRPLWGYFSTPFGLDLETLADIEKN